ncbi:DUF2982 domain-containing protein [Vibrio paucivorans]
MQTLHLSNQLIKVNPFSNKFVLFAAILLISTVVFLSPDLPLALMIIGCGAFIITLCHILILKSTVSYTLTSTHFQQHLYKGGWVVKWSNISKIGICCCDSEGWQQPLPWIGIKLKHYEPYLDGICPRIATEVLLSQRALLYLGLKQQHRETQFEDVVLDSHPYTSRDGFRYSGLLAMLANRMRHQRQSYDYDVFISANDLDRSAEEFVGLARRYLAAAEPESQEQMKG